MAKLIRLTKIYVQNKTHPASPFTGRFGPQVDTLAVSSRARLQYPQTIARRNAKGRNSLPHALVPSDNAPPSRLAPSARGDSPAASVAASVSDVKSYIRSLGVRRRWCRYIIDGVYLRRLSLFARHSTAPPILGLGSSSLSLSLPAHPSSSFFPLCHLNLCFVVSF